jgi:hypothetical protein
MKIISHHTSSNASGAVKIPVIPVHQRLIPLQDQEILSV